jgi:hypothetical protein
MVFLEKIIFAVSDQVAIGILLLDYLLALGRAYKRIFLIGFFYDNKLRYRYYGEKKFTILGKKVTTIKL